MKITGVQLPDGTRTDLVVENGVFAASGGAKTGGPV